MSATTKERMEKERREERERRGDTDTHTWQQFVQTRQAEVDALMDMFALLPLRFGSFEQVERSRISWSTREGPRAVAIAGVRAAGTRD
jgi:hypothetical protein